MVLNVEPALAAGKAKLPKCLATVQKNSVFFASACITISHVKGDIVEVNINAKGECITQDDHVEVEPPVNFVKEMKLGDFAAQLLSFAKDNHHADGLKLNMLKEVKTPEFESFIVESSVIQVCLYALEYLMFEYNLQALKEKNNNSKKGKELIASSFNYSIFLEKGLFIFKDGTGKRIKDIEKAEIQMKPLPNGLFDIVVIHGPYVNEVHGLSFQEIIESTALKYKSLGIELSSEYVLKTAIKYLPNKDVIDIFSKSNFRNVIIGSFLECLDSGKKKITITDVAA